MSKLGNEKKNNMLGMPHGTAANRLRKNILFSLVCALKANECFQCGGVIQSVEDLSIEHKEPWMQANDPVESFFDLNNIAFSHLKCNASAGLKVHSLNHTTAEDKRAHKNKVKRDWWSSLDKEEQQRMRRRSYLQCGK